MAANVRLATCKAVRLYLEMALLTTQIKLGKGPYWQDLRIYLAYLVLEAAPEALLPPLRMVLKNSEEFGSSTKTSLFLLKLAL